MEWGVGYKCQLSVKILAIRQLNFRSEKRTDSSVTDLESTMTDAPGKKPSTSL